MTGTKHVYRGVCERMQGPFGINPSNKLRLGTKLPRVCVSGALPCTKKHGKGKRRQGYRSQTCHSLQSAPTLAKSPCWPCPCRLMFGKAGFPQPSLWGDLWRKSGFTAPLCTAWSLLCPVALGTQPLLVQTVTACNATPVWAPTAHGELLLLC